MSISSPLGHGIGGLFAEHAVRPALCALCRRVLAPDDDLETISICGDCKFLLLEDLETTSSISRWRRPHNHRGRIRYSSSESIENLVPEMINLVRRNPLTLFPNSDQSVNFDVSARSLQHTSSRTTPSGSARWQQDLSDTESEGFDNVDSVYGESDTNPRSSQYRVFHSESDAISFSAYSGDYDASVDGHSLLNMEMSIQADDTRNLDSDTDIDPMHAGLNQWNLDGDEEEEEEDDNDWEEADIEEETVEFIEDGTQPQNFFLSSPSGGHVTWRRHLRSHEFEGPMNWRIRQGRQTYNPETFANWEESEIPQDVDNFEDYRQEFEQVLEALAQHDSDNARRGAPPAAVSFVHNLPRVIINEEHEKYDGLACAICRDALPTGSEANQLPCLHLYHPSCIMPWLGARNSCPLCRYELPTDDRDYERKRITHGRVEIAEIQQLDVNEGSSSNVSDGAEVDELHEFDPVGMEQRELVGVGSTVSSSERESSGRRWFHVAAGPLVSLLGIVFVLCLGNSQLRRQTSHCNYPEGSQVHGSSRTSQRGNGKRWSIF